MHVFVVAVGVAVVRVRRVRRVLGVAVVVPAMVVSGVRMAKGEQAYHVYKEAEGADDEQFGHAAQLAPFDDAFDSLPDKLNADKPAVLS